MPDSVEEGPVILIAEDNPADVFLIRKTLQPHFKTARILVAEDGEEAFQWIERADNDSQASCPELLLLDLNLPRRSGPEVLRRVRASPLCGRIPVIVLTSSDSEKDQAEVMRFGATQYIRKPSDLFEFLAIGKTIWEVWTKSLG